MREMHIDIDETAVDPVVLCWACREDITYYAVQERFWGEAFCQGCTRQLKELARAIRKAAVSDG